jgi:poly(3-hydroxybutyrate) depolymerase
MKKIILLFLGLMALGSAEAKSNVERQTYVYSIKGADTLHLDTYIDKSAEVKGKRPVMIYIHGGGYVTGSRKNVAQEIFNRHFAEMGFVSVSIDYRLAMPQQMNAAPAKPAVADKKKGKKKTNTNNNKYGITGVYDVVKIANEDVVDATNFLLSKASELNIDSSCVMISGGSAGAITCLTLEYDLCNNAPYTQKLPAGFNYGGIISHSGAIDTRSDTTLTWPRKPCPILFFHGDKDPLVPLEHGVIGGDNWYGDKRIIPDMQKMQISYWSFIMKGADHIMAMKPLTDNNAETDKFVNEIIKGKKTSYVYTEWTDAEAPDMSSVEHMVKYVPMYILGFGKYMEEMDWSNIAKPQSIVY